jgi:hypothetical protein
MDVPFVRVGAAFFCSPNSRKEIHMPKDSQPDNKEARERKCRGQTPITRENQNQNRNAKKQSAEPDDVSHHSR